MDIKTLQKVIKICESKIVIKVIESYNLEGDFTDYAKSEIKNYVDTIEVMERILDNLREDSAYYDEGVEY